ncbi:MAG: hypothetical protein LBH86_08845 [Oscillospiraceae bacterium]|jgi:serpin B|nr:hypothetical protein [Oscillospiraceae bacterium]
MKRKRRACIAFAVMLLFIVSALTACQSGTANSGEPNNGEPGGRGAKADLNGRTAPVSQVKAEIRGLENPGDEVLQVPIDGAGFAFSFGRKLLAEQKPGDNFVYSPLSVWLPLAALVNGTDAKDKDALLDTLGAGGMTEKQINAYAQMLLYRISGEANREHEPEYKSPLQIANALFVSRDETVKPSFAQTFADHYLGAVFNVDFTSQDAADAVNAWGREHTDGLIEKVIEHFDPNTVAAIANAIYYADHWAWAFSEIDTKSGAFRAEDGNATADYMRRAGDAQLYYEDDRMQAMPLDLQNGGRMWILLPRSESATELYLRMTADYFAEIGEGTTAQTGKLLLPKFEMSNMLDLRDALTALGIPLVDGHLSPITELLASDVGLHISDARQNAMIKVDEKGTTAAAVTVMVVRESAVIPKPIDGFEMICDKPFVFILEDCGQILFSGVVNNPAVRS